MANFQEQTIETTALLAGSATFTGAEHETQIAGAFGVSVFVERDSADTDVDITVEHSHDKVTWRLVELTNKAVSAGTPTQTLDKVYEITRKYLRVKLANKTANDFKTTELITMMKETK